MKKSLFTTIAIATILTAGTVKADDVKMEQPEQQQTEQQADVYVSNIDVTLDGSKINSGVINLEWEQVITVHVKVSYYGGNVPQGAVAYVETMSGSFFGELDENGETDITFGLSNRLGGETQLIKFSTNGFKSDAPQTVTVNLTEHEEELPPIIDPDDNMEQPEVDPEETIPAIPLEPAEPVDPEPKPDPEPEQPAPEPEVIPPAENWHVEEDIQAEKDYVDSLPEAPKTDVEQPKEETEQVVSEEEQTAPEVKETLPETGEDKNLAVVMLGILAVIFGFGLWLIKRKK